MIRFENVSKCYNKGHDALKRVNFHLARGEMAFMTGHSGAGKSTLLKLITMIERPSNGQLLINGKNITKLSKRRVPFVRRGMGIIFQNPHLINEATVYDNVALPLMIAGYNPADIARRVRAALDKVSLLGKEKFYPDALSGGEQQRVGIARAVANKPALILADEPTGNLDPELAAEIMQLFEQFNQVGVSVLIASHNINLISKMNHRIITLKDGQVVAQESKEHCNA